MRFEWDERKRVANLEKHELDFRFVVLLFEGDHVLGPARSVGDEVREKAVGQVFGRLVAVIFTRRDDAVRIISMRKARGGERRTYRELYG